MTSSDADLLIASAERDLPPASTWTMPPRGYRQGLALCVIDGVGRQIIGETAADDAVAAFRSLHGDAAETAGLTTLQGALPAAVGLAEAPIHAASALLADHGIDATADLVAHLKEHSLGGSLGQAWVATDGLTRRMWTDTAMLAGYLDPEVDQVISAYVARAIGSDPASTPPDRVIAALTEAAARLESSILPLEFAILRHERP